MPEDGCHTTVLVLLSLCDTQCHFFPLQMQISPHLSRLLSSFDPLIRSALPWLLAATDLPRTGFARWPIIITASTKSAGWCLCRQAKPPSFHGKWGNMGGKKKSENRKIKEFDASHRLCRWCQKFPVWVQRTIVSFRLELCLSRVNSFKVRLQ